MARRAAAAMANKMIKFPDDASGVVLIVLVVAACTFIGVYLLKRGGETWTTRPSFLGGHQIPTKRYVPEFGVTPDHHHHKGHHPHYGEHPVEKLGFIKQDNMDMLENDHNNILPLYRQSIDNSGYRNSYFTKVNNEKVYLNNGEKRCNKESFGCYEIFDTDTLHMFGKPYKATIYQH